MNAFNHITTAIFDVLLSPFGGESPWAAVLDITLWSILFGVVALVAFKYTSNQKAIARNKNAFKVRLLEIRLFKDDLLGVLGATGRILLGIALYLGFNVVPLAVMIIPMVAVLAQLEAHYAFDPMPTGAVRTLKVELDATCTDVAATEVGLELPQGVELEAGPVRTAGGAILWRLRATTPGDHVVRVRVGETVVSKGMAVGGASRRVPVMRTKTWEGILYPGEPGLAADAPVRSIRFAGPASGRLGYPSRDLGLFPGGEMGVLISFFVLSLVAGFSLKGVFGVTF